MNTQRAIEIARAIQRNVPAGNRSEREAALVELLEHGDKVHCPDLETSIRIVAANMHAAGKFYVEIAVDPKSKEVGYTFSPTPTPGTKRDPHDREYLREMAKLVSAKLPDDYGFIVLAMPFNGQGGNRLVYTSNIQRVDAIAMLKEFMLRCGAAEDWMRHL